MKTQFVNGVRVRARGAHADKSAEQRVVVAYEGEGFYRLRLPGAADGQFVAHEDDIELTTIGAVLDAGHRERQALLKYWHHEYEQSVGQSYMPFWKMLEETSYDPYADSFLMPDKKRVVTVEYCNQLGSVAPPRGRIVDSFELMRKKRPNGVKSTTADMAGYPWSKPKSK